MSPEPPHPEDELIPMTAVELERDIAIHMAAMRARKESEAVKDNPYFAKQLVERLLRSGFMPFQRRNEHTASDNDRELTFRVVSALPVIMWDKETGKRRVVPMRWGWPDPKNWRVPKPIHARAESITDPKKPFAAPFVNSQRGIVIVKTFNEAPDIDGPTIQHTVTPGELGAIGIAFVWHRFVIPSPPGTLDACVMVTVPANRLIGSLPTDRMPAVLADEDWATWLGESGSLDDAKACLKTVEGVKWTMTKEERSATVKRGKPTISDPSGLL